MHKKLFSEWKYYIYYPSSYNRNYSWGFKDSHPPSANRNSVHQWNKVFENPHVLLICLWAAQLAYCTVLKIEVHNKLKQSLEDRDDNKFILQKVKMLFKEVEETENNKASIHRSCCLLCDTRKLLYNVGWKV